MHLVSMCKGLLSVARHSTSKNSIKTWELTLYEAGYAPLAPTTTTLTFSRFPQEPRALHFFPHPNREEMRQDSKALRIAVFHVGSDSDSDIENIRGFGFGSDIRRALQDSVSATTCDICPSEDPSPPTCCHAIAERGRDNWVVVDMMPTIS